jgi:hypothetical protein
VEDSAPGSGLGGVIVRVRHSGFRREVMVGSFRAALRVAT